MKVTPKKLKDIKPLNVEDVRNELHKYTVHEKPIFVNGKNEEDWKAIAFDNNDEVISIVSQKYKIFQHTEALDRALVELKELNVNYNIIKTNYNIGDHRNTMKLTFALPDMVFDVDGSDVVATYDIVNSTDLTCCFSRIFGAYRIICSNGMVVGVKLYSSSNKHVGQFIFQDKKEIVKDMEKGFEEFKMMLDNARNVKANDDFLKSIANLGFPQKIIDNLPEFYLKYADANNEDILDYNNVWAIYAVLTNYLSNVVAKTNIRRYYDMQRSLYNKVSKMVRR